MAGDSEFDYSLKILLIGDMAVGKTCLLRRFVDNKFSSEFITTIGIDYKLKNMDVLGKRVKLQIWDTAGQERFRTITRSYFRGSNGIILVYDVTDQKSFDSINHWAKSIAQRTNDADIVKVLVGNKCDEAHPVVTREMGLELASRLNMPFFMVSAKKGINVEEAFIHAAEACVRNLESRMAGSSPAPGGKVNLEDANAGGGGSSGGCCSK